MRGVGEFVPRTGGKAIVAAIDAVADPAPQRDRDRTVVFDREIGDAAPCIEPVRRGKGRGRARILARRTAAARIAPRHRRRQVERGIDRPQKQTAAMLAADVFGVLALPPEPLRVRSLPFHPLLVFDDSLYPLLLPLSPP